jgi:nucleoside-diphosphate-sugar epimerase
VDTISEAEQAKILVIGGTGVVGGYIEHLLRRGERPFVLSRSKRDTTGIEWIRCDMTEPDTLNLPAVTTLYCTADAVLLANILPQRFGPSLKRVVVFTSTSVMTKQDTEIEAERETLRKLAEAEQTIATACGQRGVGWTILRPALIYKEGRDGNITPYHG